MSTSEDCAAVADQQRPGPVRSAGHYCDTGRDHVGRRRPDKHDQIVSLGSWRGTAKDSVGWTAALSITSVQVAGTNAGDLTVSNGCTSSMAAGGSCGIFRDVEELIMPIGDSIDKQNDNPKPFIWTAKASDIFEKVKRA